MIIISSYTTVKAKRILLKHYQPTKEELKELRVRGLYPEQFLNKKKNNGRNTDSFEKDIIAKPRKNPNLNISINSSTLTPPQREVNLLDAPHKAPPLPPKPTRRSLKGGEDGSLVTPKNEPASPITKPPLPPKPVRTPSMKKWLKDVEVSGSGRDAHVVSGEGEDDADSSDSDDEDDEYVHKHTSLLHRRSSSPNLTDSTRRRPGITESLTDSPTDEESPYSSHLTSPTTPASFYSAIAVPLSMPNLLDQRPKMISVVPEGAVNPNYLVPATTMSESDNTQSPSSTSSSQYTDHVPEIPASPLLIHHAQIEQKILTLEAKLVEYRKISKMRDANHSDKGEDGQAWSELSTDEINDAIVKYGNTVAGLKKTITRSRKLVFKAANDPNILEFAPHMIAYQLTLIESAIFLEIDPQSLLTHSPKNPDPKITASTDFFNYLTRIVERSILLSIEASSRAQIINHWVKVAVKLHELRNFQTLKAILAALGTPQIKRLKRTWACIPKKSMAKLDNLNELMSETRNYE
ncbi:2843_t:CDS:2, partial [Acaulospora colombiana]